MKKGCLISFSVFVLLILGGAGIAWHRVNASVGLAASERISHERFENENTRVRVVLSPEKLPGEYIPLLVRPAQLPPALAKLPLDIEDIVPGFLPYEVALLAGSDFRAGQMEVLLFINEQRGGPVFLEAINNSALFSKAPQITWSPAEMVMEGRGILYARGVAAIPEGLEGVLLEFWDHEAPSPPLLVAPGAHFLELSLDNRNGEMLTILGTYLKAAGMDWKGVMGVMEKQIKIPFTLPELLSKLPTLRAHADFEGASTLVVSLRVGAAADVGPIIEFLGNVGLPGLRTYVKEETGLVLDGNIQWNREEGTLAGAFTLEGVLAFVKARLE